MRRTVLTILISMCMIITTGYNTLGEDLNFEEMIIVEPMTYEIVDFSKQDILGHYIKLSPKSIQIYFYTKKYCKEFNVPEEIAFAVVGLETGYKGPDKFHYNPKQISSANALGPYQLLLSTAKDMYVLLKLGKRNELTGDMLLTDVELNVKLGIRYLRWLNDNISADWTIACGFYNTGYEIINEYARYAVKVYNYKNRNL